MSLWPAFNGLKKCLSDQIIGQMHLVECLLISLLSDGHLIVEGAPGLAKTKAIKTLAKFVEASFHRVQFTPDLLPSDITGTEIFRPQTSEFVFQKGPIFHNLILADEINRAPAKVQSALLEAMAERQVSVGSVSYQLPGLFMVMATQNPIEQEGTYPLPEAQLDRFLLHVKVDYPDIDAERKILSLIRAEDLNNTNVNATTTKEKTPEKPTNRRLPLKAIFAARKEVMQVFMSPAVETYCLELVNATRFADKYDAQLASLINFGVSPRATIALDRVARARAWLQQRDFVTPDDIQAMLPLVMRHRIGLNFTASAEGVTTDAVIEQLLNIVAAP